VAASAPLWVAIVTSLVSMLAFNFFFFPGRNVHDRGRKLVALFAFFAVSVVASRLSALARDRNATLNRRDELARLFDLSRDILLTTEPGSEAIDSPYRRRFQLDYVRSPAGANDFERFDGCPTSGSC
jgi:K+-sensing histidine kinase KdpD